MSFCFLSQVRDQQEAERKKVTSQEISAALEIQTKNIGEKQKSVMEDLSKVEPAVIEAQQGTLHTGSYILYTAWIWNATNFTSQPC